MGIRGLYTFIIKNLSDCIDSTELSGRTVFVDGDGFVQWLGQRIFGNHHFADLRSAKARLRSESFDEFKDSIARLVEHNEVVFVFDVASVYYELKCEKRQERKMQRGFGKDIVEQYGHFYDPLKQYDLNYRERDAFQQIGAVSYLHTQIKHRLKRDLRFFDVRIHEARDAEADVVLARLHRETENSCILGNDTDFVIHPGITNYFILDQTLTFEGHPSGTHWDVPRMVHLKKCRWGIRSDADWLLAMQSCGSDYVPQWTIRALRRHLPPKDKNTSWIEHTMRHDKLIEILNTPRFSRLKRAANVYDPLGTLPRLH